MKNKNNRFYNINNLCIRFSIIKMGCFCSKSNHGTMTKAILNDPTAVNVENVTDQPEFVNDDVTQTKDNAPLLDSPSVNAKTITVQDSSSSSSVDQNMIQKLLAEVDDYSN